jgi:hypothetical protein
MRDQFERATLLGEVELPEANNPVTFGNALDLLIQRGVLASISRPGVERREPLLGRGPGWAELASLRERLATALRAR